MKIDIKRKIIGKVSSQKIIDYLLEDRGITDKKNFLNPPHPDKFSFFEIFENKKRDFEKTIKLLKSVKENNQMIIVYTDYDADGLTGGAILWETLHLLGFKVMPYVPDRKKEGYGLSKKGIDNIKKLYDPALIITVDHGIVGHEKISYAKKIGIPIIVTDHHTPKETLPTDAFAIFHTDQLSGSGVAYFFAREIFNSFRILNTEYSILNTNFQSDYLSLASIGTIADLVPLIGVSRSIVKYGLENFSTIKRVGIREILKEAGIRDRKITPYEIGFIIAPRLNAFGRLTHGIEALRLLCTKKLDRAVDLARMAGATNRLRQDLVEQSLIEAEKKGHIKDKIIIVVSDDWQEGIIGLIASRLAEKYFRPTTALTKSDGFYKASVRSVTGFNIIKFLRQFDKLLTSVGGHSQAAGFSVDRNNLKLLTDKIIKQANREIKDSLLIKKIYADLDLPLSLINTELIDEINHLEPFGIGNPTPTFYSTGIIINRRLVGKDGRHLQLTIKNNDNILETIFFNHDQSKNTDIGQSINLIFRLEVDEWNGMKKVKGIGKYILSRHDTEVIE